MVYPVCVRSYYGLASVSVVLMIMNTDYENQAPVPSLCKCHHGQQANYQYQIKDFGAICEMYPQAKTRHLKGQDRKLLFLGSWPGQEAARKG